jgi:hypothetical protein
MLIYNFADDASSAAQLYAAEWGNNLNGCRIKKVFWSTAKLKAKLSLNEL